MRFGLVGYGRIADRHLEAIRRIGGELTRVYDPRFIGGEFAEDGPVFCQVLDHGFFESVDWVVVASPTHCHYNHVRLALQHGKPVICEKPYVLPWHPVIDSENVFIVLQLRWLDLPQRADVVRMVAPRNQAYFDSWKGNPELTGGLFFDLFIHYVDLARRYRCKFEGLVIPEGKAERWVDDFDLTQVDMDLAYERMYRDVVFRRVGIRPSHVAELHWLLGRYTERFGAGREILGKKIEVIPDGVV